MPKKPKIKNIKMIDYSAPTLPTLTVAARGEIIERFLKPDKNINWTREVTTWNRLWAAYPSEAFWRNHTLAFKLNHMSWFESVEGRANLKSAWTLFNYNPPSLPDSQIPLDSISQPGYDGKDIPPAPKLSPRRAKTVSEFLSKKTPPSS